MDDWGDGWNGGTYEISFSADGCILASGIPNDGLPGDASGECNGSSIEKAIVFKSTDQVVGCTNPLAVNYDPCAVIDDGSCVVAAPNDLCPNAISISCNDTMAGATDNASTTGNPPGICGTEPEASGVWYVFNGTGQEITASLCNSVYDTRLNVYSGDCNTLACLGGNDDFCSTRSQFTWNSLLGTDYYILVNGWNGETGSYELILNCDSACSPEPPNDLCSFPVTLILGDTCMVVQSSNFCATPATIPPSCDQFGIIEDVWFKFNTGPFDNVNLNVTPITAGTAHVALYGQCNGTEIGCLQNAVTEFNIQGLSIGTDYWLQVWNSGGLEEGSFDVCVTFPFIPPPPSNDTCEGAFSISCGQTLIGSTFFAGDSDNPSIFCGPAAESSSVWYQFIGGGEYARASLCGGAFDTRLLVYEGSCGVFSCIGSNDDACSVQSTFSWNTDSGSVYYIQITGANNAKGEFNLELTCTAPCLPTPSNDLCINAGTLSLEDTCIFSIGTNQCATSSLFNPGCDPFGHIQDVWYKFNTGADTSVEVRINGLTAQNMSFAIYSACNNSELFSHCSSIGPQTVNGLTQVTNYWLQVWNNGDGGEGTFEICLRSIIGANVPNNDQCNAAFVLTDGDSEIGTNTFSSPNSPPSCSGEDADGAGVWYTFTGTGDLTEITTCHGSTTYDTELHLYSGNCASLVCIDANDQDINCNLGPEESASTILFNSVEDTEYYVYVSGFQGAQGFFNISLNVIPDNANDSCHNATSISCGDTVVGTTTGSTADSMATCAVSNESPGVWYKISGTDDVVTASLCGSSFDTKISVFEGSCGALNCVGGDDDFCDLQSEVEFSTTSGTDYYLLIHGFGEETGNYILSITCGSLAPANDSCHAADTLICGDTISGSTRFALFDSLNLCGSDITAPDVWYLVQGTGDVISASLCQSSFDTKIVVLEGTCGNFTCVTIEDDNCGLQSRADWLSNAGTNYYLLVTGFGSASGDYFLSIDCNPKAANEDCSTASSMNCGDTVAGNTVGTSIDSSEFCDVTIEAPGIWYSVIGTGEVFSASTCGNTSFDTRLAVFEGSCDSLICVVGNEDDIVCGDGQSTAIWLSDSSKMYYILVHGNTGEAGSFELSLTCSELIIPGCTDSNAVNFNPLANADDTTCIIPPDTCGPGIGEVTIFIGADASAFSSEMSWNVICLNTNDTIFEAACGSITGDTYEFLCLDSTKDYEFNAYDDWGDGWNNGTYSISLSVNGCLLASGSPNDGVNGDQDGGCTVSTLEESVTFNIGDPVLGCTNPVATNFNPCAVVDDGNCIVLGCTDPLATNYDIGATVDDGSCAYVLPANDSCLGALTINCGDTVTATTNGATTNDNPTGNCGAAPEAAGVWYSFTGTGLDVTASLCNSGFDTRISVYNGDCSTGLVCVGGNDDFCNVTRSQFTFPSVIGTEYLILVNGWNNSTGTFELDLSCQTPCTPAVSNEDIDTFMPMVVGSTCQYVPGNNTCAIAGTITPPCDPFGLIQDLWYGFIAGPSDTSVEIHLNAITAANLSIAVYGSDSSLAFISCPADSVNLVENLQPGLGYGIQVWNNNNGDEGSFEICLVSPETFDCSLLGISTVATATTCVDSSDGSIDLTVSGGTSPYTYTWIGQSGFGSTSEDISDLAAGPYFITVSDDNSCTSAGSDTVETGASVMVAVRVFLEGPYQGGDTMHDALRANGLIPLVEPYSTLGFVQAGPGGGESIDTSVLLTNGAQAIVDWVLIELRDAQDSTEIVATRSALVQKDGDVVDTDGVSSVLFSCLDPDDYFVAIRHRNHLGTMTAEPISLSGSTLLIKFNDPTTPTYGVEAQKNINATTVLWAGNVVIDPILKYSGASNDRDPILVRIGGTVPTNTVIGYHPEDVNLDAIVKYAGASNDRDVILVNIGGAVPTNVRQEQIP